MSAAPEIAARVYRGESVEAIHYASIAVVDGDGELTHYLGDPEQLTMTRSSIKPFQALPLLTTGAADHFGFSPKQLAIMCGSHIGSDEHREVVMSNLEAAENIPDDLLCGCHWPLGMRMKNVYPTADEDHDPVRHNCSGKHSGFLALARFVGDPRGRYLHPDSVGQHLVKKALSDMAEFPADQMPVGIDGCSAPNFPMPVKNLALAFKKLANLESSDPQTAQALPRVRQAMYDFPEMVSGEGRLDLDIMRSFPNNVVCKVGAESIEGIGFAEPKIGICVKIHDGNQRALGAVCVEVFRQLGILKQIEDYPHLQRHERPEVRNVRKIVTGNIVPEFELRRV